MSETCFVSATSLSTLSFESPTKLVRIIDYPFWNCGSLSSIESMGERSFSFCSNLAAVTFGAASKLSRIPDHAFNNCLALNAFCIPASVGGCAQTVSAIARFHPP
jgi:hypothetical protein